MTKSIGIERNAKHRRETFGRHGRHEYEGVFSEFVPEDDRMVMSDA
jgi:hypothetical protein